jgi:hypothetical protein
MRFSLSLTAYVLDEREGTLEVDYFLKNLTDNEKLSVFINGEERCKISVRLINYRQYIHKHRGKEAFTDEILSRA